MHKKIFITITILLFYLVICDYIYISSNNKVTSISNKSIVSRLPAEKPIANIKIPKINLNNNIYSINSKHNNVEENVTILEQSILPNKNNSIMFIAAHSGNSDISYFKNLDKLSINDEIIFDYDNIKYKYYITNIWEDIKDGYIRVNKDYDKQLVLTTCSPNDNKKQLIINSKLKESK